NNPEIARTVRMLRDWGAERRYHHDLKGFNYRMEGVQGAILRVKMAYIEHWTELRRAAAARYDAMLAPLGIQTPVALPDRRHVYHIYAIRDRQRDALQTYLHDHGVSTGIHYPIPVHLQKAFADLGYRVGDFPQAELAAAEVLSLPMFPELTVDQQQVVAEALQGWMQQVAAGC
ncbi:DegT/DnrJ/EryC1/StrS family aminotransferase, partial [Chloroflexus sp.]